MSVTIKIQGLDGLVAKLQKLASGLLDEILENSIKDSANGIVLPALKLNTPVDTGNLRDSHYVELQKFYAAIGPDLAKAPYAPFVEYGHHTRSGSFVQGQKFVERTGIDTKQQVLDLFSSNIKKAIDA